MRYVDRGDLMCVRKDRYRHGKVEWMCTHHNFQRLLRRQLRCLHAGADWQANPEQPSRKLFKFQHHFCVNPANEKQKKHELERNNNNGSTALHALAHQCARIPNPLCARARHIPSAVKIDHDWTSPWLRLHSGAGAVMHKFKHSHSSSGGVYFGLETISGGRP